MYRQARAQLKSITSERPWSWIDAETNLDDEDLELLAVELDRVRAARAVRVEPVLRSRPTASIAA